MSPLDLPNGWSFARDVPSQGVEELFAAVFDEPTDLERLKAAHRCGIRDAKGSLLAAAVVELDDEGIAYLWLCAVRASARRQGLGRRLLKDTVQWCSSQKCQAIRLKTYQRWNSMRRLLQDEGWTLCAATLSKRNDGVGELWQYPLLAEPLGIIVIGANPGGRGGEWVERILQLPEVWKLEGVVDSGAAAREFWQKRGIATFAGLDNEDFKNVRAVVVAVPPGAAAEIQKNCFQRGLAVLAEKPFASSLTELSEIQEALIAHPVALVTGVQRRSHPSYVALRALLADGQVEELSVKISLGRAFEDSLAGHRSNPKQCRGGALIDLGYHALDLVQFLLNHPLEMVACSLSASQDLARGIESAADVLGRAGKTWVRIQVDRHGSEKTEQVQARIAGGIWRADRERVWAPDGSVVYACERSWELAESGRLVDLALACLRSPQKAEDLWEHLAAFETIERAYGLAELLGVKGTTT